MIFLYILVYLVIAWCVAKLYLLVEKKPINNTDKEFAIGIGLTWIFSVPFLLSFLIIGGILMLIIEGFKKTI